MHLRKLQAHWNALGDTDPLWAILTDPARKGGKWEREEFFRIGEQEIAEVLRAAGERGLRTRRGVALDFGCGVGRLTQALCAHFEECCGVDIAPSMIRLAREYNRYGARCRYELNPAADLRLFPDERFDFVYSSLVLQHMRPRYARRYIGEFLRVLARGGGLIFRLPAGLREPPGRLERLWSKLYWRAKDSLAALGALVGKPMRPRIEMYGMSRTEVLEVIARHGGETVAVDEDHSAGPAWISFVYFVRKP